MCRGRNHVKIGLYTFDKDKIPCQSPIHTENISIRGRFESHNNKDSKHGPSCVVYYIYCLEISSGRRSSRGEMKRGERRPWHQSHFGSHTSTPPVTQLFTKH